MLIIYNWYEKSGTRRRWSEPLSEPLFDRRDRMVRRDIALAVEPGPLTNVPTLGPISLQGVLRSELETHLETEIGRFILSPRVEAHALIRVSIAGVGQPGFYTMRADVPLSEAVMLAGGPGAADPGEIRIERGEEVLWSVEELLAPVADGRTLDELGLQAGDRIILPELAGTTAIPWQVLQYASYILVPVFLGVSIEGCEEQVPDGGNAGSHSNFLFIESTEQALRVQVRAWEDEFRSCHGGGIGESP